MNTQNLISISFHSKNKTITEIILSYDNKNKAKELSYSKYKIIL